MRQRVKLFTKCLFGRRSVLQIFSRVLNVNLIKSNVEVRLFQTKYMNIPSHAYGMESDCVGLYFKLHCLLSSSLSCLLRGATLLWAVPCQRNSHGLDTNRDCGDIGRYSETDVVRSTERSPLLKRSCLLHTGWCCAVQRCSFEVVPL